MTDSIVRFIMVVYYVIKSTKCQAKLASAQQIYPMGQTSACPYRDQHPVVIIFFGRIVLKLKIMRYLHIEPGSLCKYGDIMKTSFHR